MNRIIVAAIALAFTGAAFAQAPQNKWRSPFTSAPGGTPLSKLDEEKQAPVQRAEMIAWSEKHPGKGFLARMNPARAEGSK